MTTSVLKCINDEIGSVDDRSGSENRFDPLYSGVFTNNIYSDLSKYTSVMANKNHMKQVVSNVLGFD